MKKGFTLVELLAVIVIIGVVTLIAVPAVMKNISESREKLYNTQIENIELAAKKWATDSIEELDSEYLNSSFVSVEMLRDESYLSKEKVKNPITGEIMNGCVEVAYDSSNKIYTYTYSDGTEGCIKGTNASGYFYTKDDEGDWQLDPSSKKESIYSYLVGDDEEKIVAAGAGLYDLGDRYVFRGGAKNNYVKVNDTLFRIISLDKNTKSLKLISTTTNGASGTWGNSADISFNASALYSGLNTSSYSNIVNPNVKWNIGKIISTENLNLSAVKTYENKTQIVSEVGLISMSEYMEASLNLECSNGDLSKCGEDNYLNIGDSWTTTTTENNVVYVNSSKGLSYESNLNAVHNIYRVINVKATEVTAGKTGELGSEFVITG